MVIGLVWHICARGDEGHELCFISIQSTSWYPKDHTHKHIERDTTCVEYKGATHTVTHPQKGNLKLHRRLLLSQSYSFRCRDQSQTDKVTHTCPHTCARIHSQKNSLLYVKCSDVLLETPRRVPVCRNLYGIEIAAVGVRQRGVLASTLPCVTCIQLVPDNDPLLFWV